MRRTHWLFIPGLAFVLVLTGCTNNIFASFDEAPEPPGPEAYAYDPADPPSVARAELAAQSGIARIVQDENATELVRNFASVVGELAASEEGEEPDPEELIAALMPDFDNRDEFDAMLDVMLAASGDFNTLAADIGALAPPDDDGDGVAEFDQVELGFNSGEQGDIVQMALLSIVVDVAATSLTTTTGGDGRDALWEISQGNYDAVTIDDTNDPFNEMDSGNLETILTWAGLGDVFGDEEVTP